jgi:hypothetical protein
MQINSFSQRALEEICKIQKELNLPFIDSALEFCDRQDLDVMDFLDKIDASVEERLMESAISEGRIQKKYVKTQALQF